MIILGSDIVLDPHALRSGVNLRDLSVTFYQTHKHLGLTCSQEHEIVDFNILLDP